MARTVPLILGLLVIFSGFLIFTEPSTLPISPMGTPIGKHIFILGTFFELLNNDLYPRRFRLVHWTIRSVLEFIVGIFFLEYTMCYFWYPLENILLTMNTNAAKLVKDHTPRNGYLKIICRHVFEILTHHFTPVILSIALSLFILLSLLHGTRTIDFRVLRSGYKDFAIHVVNQTKRGICRIKKSFQFRSDASQST